MTIKLLACYGPYQPGTILTLDSATETALIAANQATSDTTGGAVPSPQPKLFPTADINDVIGIYATLGALPAASGYINAHAAVGSAAPYTIYRSDGSAWIQVGSGTVTAANITDATANGRTILTDAATSATVAAVAGASLAAPTALNATAGVTLASAYNNRSIYIAASAVLTLDASAIALIPQGITIDVQRSGNATLAFSGGASRDNTSGLLTSSVTLLAGGIYTVRPSPWDATAVLVTAGLRA